MKNEDLDLIQQNILNEAKINNLNVTDNLQKISKAKLKFFGLNDWYRCPCYGQDDLEHGCGKEACLNEIKQNGICHCKLFTK